MAAERKHTDRDLALARREAYTRGAIEGRGVSANVAQQWAADKYPLPTVTRPRALVDPTPPPGEIAGYFRVNGTRVQWSPDGERAWSGIHCEPTPERIALWIDLLATPTEEVEADA